MDDSMFFVTPWTRDTSAGSLKRSINKLWPEQMRDYTRFYALGIDAYQLIPQLAYLRMFQHERFNGNTGVLHLDEDQHLFRSLKWVQLNKGLSRLLE